MNTSLVIFPPKPGNKKSDLDAALCTKAVLVTVIAVILS